MGIDLGLHFEFGGQRVCSEGFDPIVEALESHGVLSTEVLPEINARLVHSREAPLP